MELINNTTKTLKDDLSVEIKQGSKLSIAAACFSIYAFQELKEQLSQIEELRFIFTSPTFVTEKAKKERREFYIPRLTRERNLYGTEFEIKLRNELTQKAIARECAEWIRQKVTFKSNVSDKSIQGQIVVDGVGYTPINNFTTVELGCEKGNVISTTIVKDESLARTLLADFNEIWNDSKVLQVVTDVLCYAKQREYFVAGEEIKSGDVYPKYDKEKGRYYKTQLLRKWGSNSRREDRPNLFYPITAPDGTEVYPVVAVRDSQRPSICEKIDGCWRHGASTMEKNIKNGLVEFVKQDDGTWIPYEKIFAPLEGEEKTKKYTTWIDETNDGAKGIKDLFGSTVFDYPKSPNLLVRFLKMAGVESGDIILDFFSGSATTAHAVMQLNAEDGGHRKFIMVQLPEKCDEKSEAYKAGYKTICEIGKERIRRAGKKIREENADNSSLLTPNSKLDTGFRVLKCDTSNMKDVYYNPAEYEVNMFSRLEDNIKEDRTPEDLLFQVMLDLGVLLSSKIEETTIAGKKVFNVEDNYLIACFDSDVSEETIKAIAKQKPYYFVMRDSSMASDSVATNFDQIFATYSPDTVRKVL